MASGIFFSEESAYIVARILGHTVKHEEEKVYFFPLNYYSIYHWIKRYIIVWVTLAVIFM